MEVPVSQPKTRNERWLLTRKTWRYMTDAVGNLLPQDPPTRTDVATSTFHAVCDSQTQFLIWTPKPPAPSPNHPDHDDDWDDSEWGSSWDREEPNDPDEYDEYDDSELDVVTVREAKRKPSLASSITLKMSGLLRAHSSPPNSPNHDLHHRSIGVQTDPFPDEILTRLRRQCAIQETPAQPAPSPAHHAPPPAHKKDVESGYSSSISDTVMRYLRMVRKNSKVDKSDEDRFKTVNYDRSLRNIKSKTVSDEDVQEHERNKELEAQGTLDKSKAGESGKSDTKVGRILPSVGIQAGESLVKFLKLFNRRKTSDFSSSSYPSSESSASALPLPSPTASLPTLRRGSSGASTDTHFSTSTWQSSAHHEPHTQPVKAHRRPKESRSGSTQQLSVWRDSRRRTRPDGRDDSQVMHKSKSSSSVAVHAGGGAGAAFSAQASPSKIMSKSKLFKSKKQQLVAPVTSPGADAGAGGGASSRAQSWAPQSGRSEVWARLLTTKQLPLQPTQLTQLSELERLALQNVALANLHQMDLGVDIKIPREKLVGDEALGGKPKRRPYLLKKKALSTGFFDSGKVAKEQGFGQVFGISLSECVRKDVERRRRAEEGEGAERVRGRRGDGESSVRALTASTSSMWSMESTHSTPDTVPSTPTSGAQAPVEAGQVPELVVACVKHLETYGLHTTGIFRVSSSLKRTRQLREDIDSGGSMSLGPEHSPHDVAALLKEFLRDLPEPLLSRDLYQAFLRTLKIRERKAQLESMRALIQLLPVANRDTLHALLQLFSHVVANSGDTRSKSGELVAGNKMEAYSLATLIAPNILPCMPIDGGAAVAGSDQNALVTRERRDSIDVVNFMITNLRELFTVAPDTLEQLYVALLQSHPDHAHHLLRTNFPAHHLLVTNDAVHNQLATDELPKVLLRKREEILHHGAGKGGCVKSQGRELGSREKIQPEKGGGDASVDSDSSSTKSTSRWFRKGRATEPKHRASSDSGQSVSRLHLVRTDSLTQLDSGGDNGKLEGARRKKKAGRGMSECKRASSLDSVNVRELREVDGAGTARFLINTNTSWEAAGGAPAAERQRSSSDQALKIPVDLSRRQSSPLLEARRLSDGEGAKDQHVPGVIRASLKIQMPINIDDTDIPFIEEDNSDSFPKQQLQRQRSSPVQDYTCTFPYQEIQARICLGQPPSHFTTSATAGHSAPRHRTEQPPRKTASIASIPSLASPPSPPHTRSPVTPQGYRADKDGGRTSRGKETKGANIVSGMGASGALAALGGSVGLIKSKTADFEKLVATKTGKAGSCEGTSGVVGASGVSLKSRALKRDVERSRSRGLSVGGQSAGLSKTSTDLGGAASSPTWKRSEIIASPARKHATNKETFL